MNDCSCNVKSFATWLVLWLNLDRETVLYWLRANSTALEQRPGKH